jgi:hypothetical protein
VLNTPRPFGAALPNLFTESETPPPAQAGELPRGNAEAVRRTFETGQPTYTDLFLGLVSQRPTVSLVVPVLRQGRVVYVLALSMLPEGITRLLQNGLPADALSGIVDRQGKIVARLVQPEQFVGRPVTANTRADLAASATGWGLGRSQEQVPIYRAWTPLARHRMDDDPGPPGGQHHRAHPPVSGVLGRDCRPRPQRPGGSRLRSPPSRGLRTWFRVGSRSLYRW